MNHLLPLCRTLQSEGASHVSMLAFQDDHGFEKVRAQLGDVILGWMDTVR